MFYEIKDIMEYKDLFAKDCFFDKWRKAREFREQKTKYVVYCVL